MEQPTFGMPPAAYPLPTKRTSWLLFDGECGLCGRVIAWVRQHDKEGRIAPIPFQHAPAPPMTPELRAACEKSIHVLTGDGRVLRAGRASLFVLAALGYKTMARVLSLPPLIWAVELGYRIVAANRDFFGRFLFTSNHPEP